MCSALQRHFDRNVGSDGSSPEATERRLCQLKELKISHLDPINTQVLTDAVLLFLAVTLVALLGVNGLAKVCLHLALQGMFDRYYHNSTGLKSFCQHSSGALF